MNRKQLMLSLGAFVVVLMVITASMALWSPAEDDDRIVLVASFYPLGYLSKEIAGDKVNVKTLIPENTEVHAWSPTASDILKANKADILVYNGAGLEPWFENSLLPAIDTSEMKIVDTVHGLELIESYHHDLTRLFIFDNDNSRTLVYDIEGESAVLVSTFPFGLNVTPHSGFFDNAPITITPDGYTHLYVPNDTNLTVLNSGLHGDHFHSPELVTTIPAGKPIHYALSPSGDLIAWALDIEQKVLVVNTAAPGIYSKYDDGGTNATSHATLEFDQSGLLYIAEMRTHQDENMRIINVSNGEILYQGGAGQGPHGAVYSPVTDMVYINCRGPTFGLTMFNSSGYQGMIDYTHDGGHLGRSWISDNGTWLISYVGSSAPGLAYSNVMAYDLLTESLAIEVPVHIPSGSPQTGWAGSIFLKHDSIVALSNPQNGTVVLVDMISGTTSEIALEGTFPQSLRLVEDKGNHALWAVTSDGYAHIIGVEHGEIKTRIHLDAVIGVNNVLAAVSVPSGDHDQDHGHGLVDPHTWISPFLAKQQAQNIYEALVEVDQENEAYYTERWNSLRERLIDLDERYMSELAHIEKDHIFVSHAAYGYLSHRYGFHQEGVIGIMADEQPSASAINALVNKMVQYETYVVYLDPVFSSAYVQTLKTNVEAVSGETVDIFKLYLMTGTVDGLDYLEQMEANLENLKYGLDAQGHDH